MTRAITGNRLKRRVSACAAAALACVLTAAADASRSEAAGATADVLIFAAASLKSALDELVPSLERAAGARVRISYAASSALAKQIEAGAPAALFISADTDWMAYLAERNLIQVDSRIDLLANRLALVAPRQAGVVLTIAPRFSLRQALGDGRLAIADPTVVPAGKYAKAALTSLGVWNSVADRLAPAENVRAALLLVARGEVPMGIVYETDARAEPAVRLIGLFPESSHPAIVYPAALTVAAASPGARRVLDTLSTPGAGVVFRRHGFSFLP
jgi:molybdate transport system substrate-binding protein